MAINFSSSKNNFGKTIFASGQYIQYFKPDSVKNPFYKIYKRKKQDTIEIINKSKYNKSILDVGGGMGRLSIPLSESSQNEVVLSDISFDMLKQALDNAESLNNLKIVNSDANELPFRDNSFDIIVGLDLFCHLGEPEKALSEFHRILKNQGLLILDSTNGNPLWVLFYPRYMGANPFNWLKIIHFKGVLPGWEKIVKHYSKKIFFSLLKKNHFKILCDINYGPRICPKWHLAVSQKVN